MNVNMQRVEKCFRRYLLCRPIKNAILIKRDTNCTNCDSTLPRPQLISFLSGCRANTESYKKLFERGERIGSVFSMIKWIHSPIESCHELQPSIKSRDRESESQKEFFFMICVCASIHGPTSFINVSLVFRVLGRVIVTQREMCLAPEPPLWSVDVRCGLTLNSFTINAAVFALLQSASSVMILALNLN